MAKPKYNPTKGVKTAAEVFSNSYTAGASDVNSAYKQGLTALKNSYSSDRSNLGAEQSKVNPLFQTAIKSIGQNEFNTKESQNELMNSGGWNTSNSGLAVGEMTRIANVASQNRAGALDTKNTTLADIARRRSLVGNQYNNNLIALAEQKTAGLTKARSSAQLTADNFRQAQIAEQNRKAEADRAYALQVAAMNKARSSGGGSRTTVQRNKNGLTASQQLSQDNKDISLYSKNFEKLYSKDPNTGKMVFDNEGAYNQLVKLINSGAVSKNVSDKLEAMYGITAPKTAPEITGDPVYDNYLNSQGLTSTPQNTIDPFDPNTWLY